jgi:hypothetical protein
MVATAMLALLPVAGLQGCANSTSDDGSNAEAVGQQLITADTIAGLKSGEQLVLDQREKGVAYTFDFSKAPIDFSRITLLNNDGAAQPMDKWLSAVKESGRDLLAARDHKFRLSSSAQSFEDLSATEIAQLQSTGSLVKKGDARAIAPGTTSEQALVCREVPRYSCIYTPEFTYCWISGSDTECEEVEY